LKLRGKFSLQMSRAKGQRFRMTFATTLPPYFFWAHLKMTVDVTYRECHTLKEHFASTGKRQKSSAGHLQTCQFRAAAQPALRR